MGWLLIAAMWASAAFAGDISGPAQVVDGDSIVVAGKMIRLHGIDAPEWHQTCPLPDGSAWHAGQEATAFLRTVVGSQTVACSQDDYDAKYHRIVATCYAGGVNLNKLMVGNGWAFAYRHYSERYVPEEDAAKAQHIGVWRATCEAPWDWRHEHPRKPEK